MTKEIIEKINLQLFADEPEGAEDDTPEEGDESLDTPSVYEEEEDSEEEETEEEETEEEETEGAEEEPPHKTFTQDEVNRIVGNARIKGREYEQVVNELQGLTGLEPAAIVEHIKKSQIEQKSNEWGLTEEEAKELVEKDAKLAKMETRMKNYEGQQQQLAYNNEKSQFLHDPIVKKYENEIDAFAHDQQGNIVANFEVAMNYILGQKLSSGELKKVLQEGTEQKTLANIKKRGKASPETSTVSGASSSTKGLTKEERQLCSDLGIAPKEFLANKKKSK